MHRMTSTQRRRNRHFRFIHACFVGLISAALCGSRGAFIQYQRKINTEDGVQGTKSAEGYGSTYCILFMWL